MQKPTRRQFLQTSAAAAGAASFAVPAIAQSRAGANDRIRVGMLGLGGRMRSHMAAVAKMEPENVDIVAICDCDQRKLDNAGKMYPEIRDKKLATFTDMRKMFDGDAIDAVSISLGDRWHSLATIWACQAGKDVYVEKPAALNLFEANQVVAAANKYGRMVQHGTQNRSSPNIREGIEKLKEGVVGDVYMARGIDYKIRGHLGHHNPSPVPEGLDWDAWTGPAPLKDFSNFHYRRWYWQKDYACGPFANQAIHELDILRWGLGLDEHPVEIHAVGANYVHDDDRDLPSHVSWTYKFGDGPNPTIVSYEHRSWYTNAEAGLGEQYQFVQQDYPVGTMFYGTKGFLMFPDYSSYYTFFGRGREPGPFKAAEGHEMADLPHFQNWIKACRSRKTEDLNAGVHELKNSMALSLLAKTSYLVGRTLKFDPKTERCVDDEEANRLLEGYSREPYTIPEEV
jgi:predicted dehydrogenase